MVAKKITGRLILIGLDRWVFRGVVAQSGNLELRWLEKIFVFSVNYRDENGKRRAFMFLLRGGGGNRWGNCVRYPANVTTIDARARFGRAIRLFIPLAEVGSRIFVGRIHSTDLDLREDSLLGLIRVHIWDLGRGKLISRGSLYRNTFVQYELWEKSGFFISPNMCRIDAQTHVTTYFFSTDCSYCSNNVVDIPRKIFVWFTSIIHEKNKIYSTILSSAGGMNFLLIFGKQSAFSSKIQGDIEPPGEFFDRIRKPRR